MITKMKNLFMLFVFGTIFVMNTFNIALAAGDEDAKMLFMEGRQLMAGQQYAQAVEKFQLALTKNISDYNKNLLYLNLGECYEELNDPINAEDSYKKAVTPGNPAPSVALGDFYERRGEYDKAIPVLKTAIKWFSNVYAEPYLVLASCYEKTGAWQECKDVCSQYIGTSYKRIRSETDLLIYMHRAIANANLQHIEDTLNDLNYVEKMSRKSGDVDLINEVRELKEATLNYLKAYMDDNEYQDFLKRLK